VSVSKDRLVSRCLADLVGPGMDHWFAADVIEICQDPRLKFCPGSDADVTEHQPRHLGEGKNHEQLGNAPPCEALDDGKSAPFKGMPFTYDNGLKP
jgi:hypothetical protein